MMRRFGPLAAIVAIVGAAISFNAGGTWVGRHDYASSAFATIARNHLRYGLGATRGASVLRVDRQHPDRSPIYPDHPFAYPLALAGWFAVAGPSELAARSASIALALATIVFLYLIVESTFGRSAALIAATVYGLAPVNLYYGRLVSLEQPIVLAITAATWFWLRWITHDRWRDYCALLAVMAIGMLIEWQAYYLGAVLPLHYLLVVRKRPVVEEAPPDNHRRKRAAVRRSLSAALRDLLRSPRDVWPLVGLVLLAPGMFLAFLAHLDWAAPEQFEQLQRVFLYRVGLLPADEALASFGQDQSYGVGQFLSRLGAHFWSLFTPPMLIVAGGAAIALVRGAARRTPPRIAASIPLVLLGPAVCHTLIFHRTLYVHDCLTILYLPGVAMLAGIGWDWLFAPRILGNPRVVAGGLLAAWFLGAGMMRTMELHGDVSPAAGHVGVRLAEWTRAGDRVVVVGLRYHPAVEWYADRDIYFLDADGPIDEIVVEHAPNRLLWVHFPRESDPELSKPADAAAAEFAKRTGAARRHAEQHGRPSKRSDELTLFELSPASRATPP